MDIIEEMRSSPDFARGRAEAESEIQADILGQRAYGKLVAWWEDAAQVLKERYGIQSQIVASCMIEKSVAAAALGYNERMAEAIRARFGSDVVAATWREVERKVKKHGQATLAAANQTPLLTGAAGSGSAC